MTTKTAELIRQLTDRRIGTEELRLALDHPVDSQEREAILALVAWFTRRYPTGSDRLAYVRRAYVRWQRTRSIASPADLR